MILPAQELRSLGNSNIHIGQSKPIFSSDFQLTCCKVTGNNLISPHVEVGVIGLSITEICWRKCCLSQNEKPKDEMKQMDRWLRPLDHTI
jgi:hypothetical protein